MARIKITKAEDWNWYKVGEEYIVKDPYNYQIGVQVYKENEGKGPDVVQFGHFIVVK